MLALQANTRMRFSDNVAPPPVLAGALPPCRLMVVDDDEWMRFMLASILRSARYAVDVADSGKKALRLLRAAPYDILLTDCQMPGMDGLTLCQQVREEFPAGCPYILMFTIKETRKDRYAGLKSGVDEYITKGASESELLEKLAVGRRIRLSHHRLAPFDVPSQELGFVDPLTDAHNSAYFARRIAKEIERAQRRQRPLAVLNCRIERLDQTARVHGRAAADEALCAFADDVRQCLRAGPSWFARIGDDRFVLVLPRTRFTGAERLARKLRRRFADLPVITTAGSIHCAVSIDVTASESWLDWTPLHQLAVESCTPREAIDGSSH